MEQIIDQTTNGQYVNNTNSVCTAGPLLSAHPTFGSGTSTQGSNSGCVFLGKIVQFNPNINGSPSPKSYMIFPVVGNQYYNNPNYGVTITDTVNDAYPALNLAAAQTSSVESGLKVVSVSALNSSNNPTSTTAIGIIAGDSGGNLTTSSQGYLNSGPVTSSLYYDTNNVFSNSLTQSQLSSDVSETSGPNTTFFQYTPQVTICISNGKKSASLQIGENGGLADTIKYWNTATCP
jgi:hypothetical protein